MPMPARTEAERSAFWKQLKSEIPAYLFHIMEEHKISDKFADVEEERMGVRGYHNEQALNFVEAYSNEGKRLFGIIEALRKEFENYLVWEGSASELVDILKERAKDYNPRRLPLAGFSINELHVVASWSKKWGRGNTRLICGKMKSLR